MWGAAGFLIAISTIGTTNPYSRYYWDHMSNRQKILMVFLCGPLVWVMTTGILLSYPISILVHYGYVKFISFFNSLKKYE